MNDRNPPSMQQEALVTCWCILAGTTAQKFLLCKQDVPQPAIGFEELPAGTFKRSMKRIIVENFLYSLGERYLLYSHW